MKGLDHGGIIPLGTWLVKQREQCHRRVVFHISGDQMWLPSCRDKTKAFLVKVKQEQHVVSSSFPWSGWVQGGHAELEGDVIINADDTGL